MLVECRRSEEAHTEWTQHCSSHASVKAGKYKSTLLDTTLSVISFYNKILNNDKFQISEEVPYLPLFFNHHARLLSPCFVYSRTQETLQLTFGRRRTTFRKAPLFFLPLPIAGVSFLLYRLSQKGDILEDIATNKKKLTPIEVPLQFLSFWAMFTTCLLT